MFGRVFRTLVIKIIVERIKKEKKKRILLLIFSKIVIWSIQRAIYSQKLRDTIYGQIIDSIYSNLNRIRIKIWISTFKFK